jgi:hypothetical protein
MITATFILVLSVALFFFYIQVTCQKILRRQFDREYFQFIVAANHLGFPSLRKSLEEFGISAEYPRLRMMLRCDFLALTYLLKNSANVKQRYSNEERLLILYCHWQFLSLAARHLLKFGEESATLRLASVLQYFANVVGERVNTVRFGNWTATDYFFRL